MKNKEELNNFLERMKEDKDAILELNDNLKFQFFRGFLLKIEEGVIYMCINKKWVDLTK